MCSKGVGKGLEYRKTNYVLCDLATFGQILAMFLKSQYYGLDAIAQAGAHLGV